MKKKIIKKDVVQKGAERTVSAEEFARAVTGYTGDIEYVIHNAVSMMRRMNRGDQINDWEFSMMHNTIESIFRSKITSNKKK